ncbi:uncharacterized protein PG998_011122 [Apiospora kogelbergensis]|uniref:uncharacterized protein n=1 Tax=Apiospora kogelbergensis TaxID=1337665 RepID=UPI0031302271
MSQPPYAYGQYTGQQSQQNFQYIPNANQPPGLSYGAMPQAPNPAFITGNFAATNNSFEQNSSRIPGLGMGGGFPSSVAAPAYPTSNDTLWRPGDVTIPKAPNVPNDFRPQKASKQQPNFQAPVSADASQSGARSAQTAGNSEVLEEGELSEGEFEDLYEPGHSTHAVNAKPAQASRPSSTAVDNQGSAGDADESSIYDTGSSKGKSTMIVLRPHCLLSKKMMRNIPLVSIANLMLCEFETALGLIRPTFPPEKYRKKPPPLPWHHLGQNALYRLQNLSAHLPLNGLDPEIVKNLFADLGLDMPTQKPPQPSTKSSSQNHQQPATQTSPQEVTSPTLPAQTSDQSDSQTNGATRVNMADKRPRNARTKSRTTTPISPVAAAIAAPKPVESSAQLKAKTKAENTLKLQQKLAALRKAQEAEAKRKQEQATTQQTSINATSRVQSERPAPDSGTAATPQRSKQNSPKIDVPIGSPATKVPGLTLPSLSQPTVAVRNLKRPVASDFDGGYSSGNSMLKRTRTQERLIIDVSEEEDDDDEDVEMDIGSPIDGPPGAAIQTIGGGTPSQSNSLGTFPPLSNRRSQKRIAEAEAKKAAKKPNGSVTPVAAASPPRLWREKVERRERISSYHLPIVDAALQEKQQRLKQLQMEAAQVELEVQARLEERNKLSAEMDALKDIDVDIFNPTAPSPLPTPDQSCANDYKRPQSAVQESVANTDTSSSELPATGTTQSRVAPLVPSHSSIRAPSPKEAVSRPEATEDPVSSSEKSDMDIDSSDSSSDEGEDINIEPVGGGETAAPSLIRQNSLPSLEQAVPNVKEASGNSSNEAVQEKEANGPDTSLSLAESQPQTAIEVANDADASLQASVADLSADEEDPYEPVLGQISSTDKIQLSDEEEGEVDTLSPLTHMILTARQVPDDDPYEPSPAQPVGPASKSTAQAASGEVQLRSPRERKSLTMTQAEEQATTLSSEDLLSYQSPSEVFPSVQIPPKHFSDMRASDSDIIAQLGSVDSYNGEQKGRFIDGLRKVLSELKSEPKRVNFENITSAILQYRKEFFGGDDSKVLPLEGVAI